MFYIFDNKIVIIQSYTYVKQNYSGLKACSLKSIKIKYLSIYFLILDMKLQCSVCWDDFTIDEKVMKLACEHMFHKDCITPWLELVS